MVLHMKAFEKLKQLVRSIFVQNSKIYILFSKSLTLERNKIFQFCFQLLKVQRKGFHVVGLHFLWKPNAERHDGAPNVRGIFLILARHLQLRRHRYDVKICSLLLRWEITGEKFLLIPFLDQKLWVIQFYKVLYGIYCKFEVSNWGAVNISRMIHGRNMTLFEYLSNINILKDVKFGVRSVYRF